MDMTDVGHLKKNPCKADAIERVKQDGNELRFLSEFADDFDVVKAAVTHHNHGTVLKFASDRLKDDEEIVKACINSEAHGAHGGWRCWKDASARVRNEGEELFKAVCEFDAKFALEHAGARFRGDRGIVIGVVMQVGDYPDFSVLECVDDKAVKKAVLEELTKEGSAEYKKLVLRALEVGNLKPVDAPEGMKGCEEFREVVLANIKNAKWYPKDIPKELHDTKEFLDFFYGGDDD
eukprot:gnl/TRDRNA2_/TRDRNA2_36128_c0_seq1.p1 gnl/TRDRNA2_/TRDRNA2_36128_c0~~gnl/TRDRNA2_/TRDRNA2_36128_c0_seq1.p1  ORF type:complete len:235 (+),score=44.04 gnl/TRDRNA2_/TRDRNA2_36128_c0_seq1:160-864(+)